MTRSIRRFGYGLAVGCLLTVACASPSSTNQPPTSNPAADSVADGLLEGDTTVVDDDTLETRVDR